MGNNPVTSCCRSKSTLEDSVRPQQQSRGIQESHNNNFSKFHYSYITETRRSSIFQSQNSNEAAQIGMCPPSQNQRRILNNQVVKKADQNLSKGRWEIESRRNSGRPYLQRNPKQSLSQTDVRGILNTKDVGKIYINLSELGAGAYGTVHLVQKFNYKTMRFAKKQVIRDPGSEDLLQREYDILAQIDHPFITSMVEVYFSPERQSLDLITPLYEGGDIFKLMQSSQLRGIAEVETAQTIYQVLLAVNYLHQKNITHRDLKLDNLVFNQRKYQARNSQIRLIDFGFALNLNDPSLEMSNSDAIFRGTPYYMAPEVVDSQVLTCASDLWSIGVITYTMLFGQQPFQKANSEEQLFRLIRTCDFEFPDNARNKDAISFIVGLINPDWEQRFTAEQALQHPWITKNIIKPAIDEDLLKSLIGARKKTDFQHFNMLIMSELLTLGDLDFVNQSRNTFLAINTSNTGELMYRELVRAFESINVHLTAEKLTEIWRYMDHDENGSVSFTEWMCACAFIHQLNEKNLKNVFKFLNLKEENSISITHLEWALRPHIFRLKLLPGTGEKHLQKMLLGKNLNTCEESLCGTTSTEDVSAPSSQSPHKLGVVEAREQRVDFNLFCKLMGSQTKAVQKKKLEVPSQMKKQRSRSLPKPKFQLVPETN